MKRILPATVLLTLGMLFLLVSCAVKVPEFARNGCINNPVRDTLFVTLPGFEDEWVNVKIETHDVKFAGREQVVNGQVWFDIRRLPTGHYVVWIEVAEWNFPQHFWHERTF